MKRKCPKCGIEKPLNTEFFHRGKETKEGFKSSCKVCRNADKKKWRDANKERVNAQAKEYYVNHREQRSEYGKQYRINNRNELLEYAKKYHEENREQRSEYQKEYYRNNKDRVLKRTAKWAKENPDKVKEKSKRYYENHSEKVKERSIKRKSDPNYKEWYKAYIKRPDIQEKRKQYKMSEQGRQVNKRSKHKRRAIEREVLATLTLEQWKKCLKHFNNKCAYCGKEDNQKLTQEHFIPVIKGGEYTVTNIIPACGSCNFSKCDKDFFEWYPQQDSYSVTREKKILKYLDIKDNTQQIAMF